MILPVLRTVHLGLVILAGIAVLAGVTWLSFPRGEPDREWQHVFRILLRGETAYKEPRVRRWQGEVRIKVEGAPEEDEVFIRNLIHELDQLLVETDTWLKPGEFAEPDIRVRFLPPESFVDDLKRVGYDADNTLEGVIWSSIDDRSRVRHADIFIKSYARKGWRRAIIIEEITQSLAAMNDSPFIRESQFLEGYDGSVNYFTRLPDIDRKLVRFVYLYLKPGDGPEELRLAYDAHWHTMTVPPRPEAP